MIENVENILKKHNAYSIELELELLRHFNYLLRRIHSDKSSNLLNMYMEWVKGLEFISFDGGMTEVCSVCSEPAPKHKEHCPWLEIWAGTWRPA